MIYLVLVINFFSNQTDHIINQTTKQHLKKYDKHLKKFNATKALDEALAVNFNFKIFSTKTFFLIS